MNLKMKSLFIAIFIIIVTIVTVLVMHPWAKQPFKDLTTNEISEVTVKLMPPDITFDLTDADIAELVKIVNSCVIYMKDNSYTDYVGQAVHYTINKKDGTTIEITAYNPFLIIDGVGYKTKYGPCEELNSLGNKILNTNNP
ncbi:hypothetical protein [Anaerocolumna sp. MB42-C2]|uniref:hypothetical protein n=1 Tax=Anaerocolumna sp. MB42-C2 TaxID=3070997 RepID=UPI0027E06A85|nr:hypothetical protein [Anaerocolumna sp. MB42-C2]WMJ88214.1 hypothetical protein RBU59_01525 [Anaerocolumna sp. MB42-C2]